MAYANSPVYAAYIDSSESKSMFFQLIKHAAIYSIDSYV